MITRADLYRQFGPLLIEAQTLVIRDEINTLRQELGLSERTKQQILNAVQTKLDGLVIYDWLKEE